MQFRELLPFLIPGVSLQLFVIAIYVHHVINNKQLDKLSRLKYAISIIIFNLPAAAYYLLKEKPNKEGVDTKKGTFDSNVRQAIFVFLIIAYEIIAIQTLSSLINHREFNLVVWLIATGLVLMIATELTIQKTKIQFAYVQSIALLSMAFVIHNIVFDFYTQFLLIIVLASLINSYPLKHAKRFILVTLLGFISVGIIQPYMTHATPDFEEIISNVFLSFIIFALVVSSFYMLKKLYITNHDLSRTLKLIETQNTMIEELSAVEERNKIAKEIHDTVGHRLTGALLSIEAASILKDNQLQKDKLTTAKHLIKDALSDIRNSVKLLVEDNTQDFKDKADQLIADIFKNTQLSIHAEIDIESKVLSIHQHVLLRAIMECSTNTLKHSHADKADVLIQESHDVLLFSFNDNGNQKHDFNFGFGLNSMKNNVESLGGILDVSSGDDGFLVTIQLPLGRRLKGAKND